LTRAIEIDPDFPAAHAALGATYWAEYGTGWSRDPALLDRAEALGKRAIELDSGFFQGHAVVAWVALLREDADAALAAADRAIALSPNNVVGHAVRGLALAQQGRLLEATRSVRRSLRLSPRAPISAVLIAVAWVNLAADRRPEAVAFLEKTRDAAPEVLAARVALAVLYEQGGEHAKAGREVDEILRIRPDVTADTAMELVPAGAQLLGAEELARYPDLLRAAGLP
jgi:tetratricopeptide (TPR) repeat protein